MSKIDIFSDLHLDHWITKVYRGERATNVLREFIAAGKSDADIVIFAGDAGNGYHWYKLVMKTLAEFYTTVVGTPGNHDFYGTSEPSFDDPVHQLWGSIDNLDFSACPLWTNFRNKPGFGKLAEKQISDWLCIPQLLGNTYEPMLAAHKANVAFMNDVGAQIRVTHFGPIVQSVHPKYAGDALNTYFCNDMDEWFKKLDASLWVQGHTHTELDYMHYNTRVVGHPIGYPYENYSELIGIPFKTVEV